MTIFLLPGHWLDAANAAGTGTPSMTTESTHFDSHCEFGIACVCCSLTKVVQQLMHLCLQKPDISIAIAITIFL